MPGDIYSSSPNFSVIVIIVALARQKTAAILRLPHEHSPMAPANGVEITLRRESTATNLPYTVHNSIKKVSIFKRLHGKVVYRSKA